MRRWSGNGQLSKAVPFTDVFSVGNALTLHAGVMNRDKANGAQLNHSS